MGRRNPSPSPGARVSAWNLPKRLVPIGSLVFHFVYSQKLYPFSPLWQLKEIKSSNVQARRDHLYCHLTLTP